MFGGWRWLEPWLSIYYFGFLGQVAAFDWFIYAEQHVADLSNVSLTRSHIIGDWYTYNISKILSHLN